MHRFPLRLGAAALLIGLALPATAQNAEPLTIYSGRNEELMAPLIEQFTQTTGIPAQVLYADTAPLANQILEEGANSPADVFLSQDAGALGALQMADQLAPLPEALLERVPAEFESSRGEWVGVSGRARVLVYNPQLVETLGLALPQSLLDLKQPAYRGLVGWAPANASFQTSVTALRLLEGDAAAEAWLAGMVVNDAVSFGSSNTNLNAAVAAGEIPLGLTNHYYMYRLLAQDPEAQIAQHYFQAGDPGSLVNVAGAGILRTSDQPDDALAFVEFLLSDVAQQYFADRTFEYPLVDGIIANEALTPLDALQHPEIDLSDLNDLQTTLDMIEQSGALDQ
jgi:iron(III) transport system substrate-binding protein